MKNRKQGEVFFSVLNTFLFVFMLFSRLNGASLGTILDPICSAVQGWEQSLGGTAFYISKCFRIRNNTSCSEARRSQFLLLCKAFHVTTVCKLPDIRSECWGKWVGLCQRCGSKGGLIGGSGAGIGVEATRASTALGRKGGSFMHPSLGSPFLCSNLMREGPEHQLKPQTQHAGFSAVSQLPGQ